MSIDDIDNVRARLEAARAVASTPRVSDDLRALLDDHARLAACDEGEHHEVTRLRSEAERLTRERDAALANTHTMVAALDDLASANVEVERLTRERDAAVSSLGAAHETLAEAYRLREDRDRLAAALAEVRKAWMALDFNDPRVNSSLSRLSAAIFDAPARLAAAHDARVRAEGASAMRAEAARRLRNIYTRARKATVGAEAAAIVEAITPDEAIRAEAERIGGGR